MKNLLGQNSNPARRLRIILEEAAAVAQKRQQNNMRVWQVWAEVFRVGAEATPLPEVLRHVAGLMDLVDETRAALMAKVPKERHQLYLMWHGPVSSAICMTAIEAPWSTISDKVSGQNISTLLFSELELEKYCEHDGEVCLDDATIEEFRNALREQLKGVRNIEDEVLREALTRAVNALLFSLSGYKLGGIDALVEAAGYAYGMLLTWLRQQKAPEERSTRRDGVLEAFHRLVERILRKCAPTIRWLKTGADLTQAGVHLAEGNLVEAIQSLPVVAGNGAGGAEEN